MLLPRPAFALGISALVLLTVCEEKEPPTIDGGAAEQGCAPLAEPACKADSRCLPLFATTHEEHCAGRSGNYNIYAGCVTRDVLCNTVITWGTNPQTGQTLVFACSRVPAGWVITSENQCGRLDGGS